MELESLSAKIQSLWAKIADTQDASLWPVLLVWLNRVEKTRREKWVEQSLNARVADRYLSSLHTALTVQIKDFFQTKGYARPNGDENYLLLVNHTELYLAQVQLS